MKVFVFACLIAYVSASSLHLAAPLAHVDAVAAPAVVAAPALLSTGSSTQSRSQDAAGNYAFAYNEQHATGGSSRSESGGHGVASGSYTLNVADGRQRTVNYVADGLGFRAAIATNEPGTAAQAPASTALSSPYAPPQPVAPLPAPVAIAAPIAHAPALAVAHAPAPIAVAHHAPALIEAHAPLLHAPLAVAHHAPVAVAHIPAISHYSTSVNHVSAPALLAAPALHHAHLAAPALHHAHLAAPALHYRK